MSDLFRKRITEFLDEYIVPDEDMKNEVGYSPMWIKRVVKHLIENGVFTAREICTTLLDYDVILPPYTIETWVEELNAI